MASFSHEHLLTPFFSMIPNYVHPLNGQSISTLLSKVTLDSSLRKVMPVPSLPSVGHSTDSSIKSAPPTCCHWTYPISYTGRRQTLTSPTQLMAIINTTPDSFSDGADHNSLLNAISFAKQAVKDGANILDIGGYSTRPGAAFVSVQDEIDRVVPVVSAIRADDEIGNTLISVDTFRPEVARAAILAGANIINDVYAFTGPSCYPYPSADMKDNEEAGRCMVEMKSIAREFSVPVVLMHSRADAGSNKDYSAYLYAGEDQSVIEGIRVELGRKVEEIVLGAGGLRRWLVMVDPGVGFSKTVEGNLESLRYSASVTADILIGPGECSTRLARYSGLNSIRAESDRRRNPLAGYPTLIGSSRKSFLGTILAEHGRTTTPKERNFATAATIAAGVQQGAVVVRVHDVREMADVLWVSDRLW